MASMNEVMSHKNQNPKWMTDSPQQQPGEVLNKKHTGSNEKEVSTQPKTPKAPEIPQTHFRVRMCCNKCEEKAKEEAGEVAGVLSVITDPSQSRVTVLGQVDSASVLKKLKKHVDKKATHWPAEQPAAKVVLPTQNVSEGGVKLENVATKGSGEKKTENASKGDMKDGYNVDDKELAGGHGNVEIGPGMSRPARPTGVDAMRADPRMVDPRTLDAMRADPRMMDPMMVDPRRVRGGPHVDPREMMAFPVDPRGMRGSAEMREGWLVDPREMRGAAGHGDMRSESMWPVDPRVMRGVWPPHVDPVDHQMRGMQQPVDAREKMRSAEMKVARQHVDPREIRTGSTDHMREAQRSLDAREMQAYEYVAAAERRRDMQQHPSVDSHGSRYTFDPHKTRAQLPQESYYMSKNKSRELADSQYQPNASYFSDYRPSQSYPANYSSSGSYYEEVAVTNPNYMKQVLY